MTAPRFVQVVPRKRSDARACTLAAAQSSVEGATCGVRTRHDGMFSRTGTPWRDLGPHEVMRTGRVSATRSSKRSIEWFLNSSDKAAMTSSLASVAWS